MVYPGTIMCFSLGLRSDIAIVHLELREVEIAGERETPAYPSYEHPTYRLLSRLAGFFLFLSYTLTICFAFCFFVLEW